MLLIKIQQIEFAVLKEYIVITTKERSNLRALAHDAKTVVQLGKGGISESVMTQTREHLYHMELIKVKVLQNADFSAKEVGNDFAASLEAEIVSIIGGIITLYKFSDKKGIEHIKF